MKPETLRPEIEVMPAPLEQKHVLANLLELYSHDFCEFIDRNIGSDGRFGYRELDLYWTEADRLPFLLYVHNQLAGFALIRTFHRDGLDDLVWDVTEFFIVRGYRGQGIGTEAAHRLWNRFPGLWEVRVMAANRPAYRFWRHAIQSFAGDDFFAGPFRQAGRDWHRFSFRSKSAAGLG